MAELPQKTLKPRTRIRGCLGCMGKLGVLGGAGLAAIALVGAIGLGVGYKREVLDNPGPHLDRDHIRAIIAQESAVFYRDGQTRIGVFFEDEHRQYVPWEGLPLAWTMGIVGAEDGDFWTHRGVSMKHIARAMRDNIAAGHMVAGGSTLTQQTAKNLYYRPDRSLKSKLTELLNALRLEAHYSKSEILAFYGNQFHVTGNGRGLGIAARHFFDKRPEELTTLECAFIAGLVKAPSRYDPFIGDEARRAGAAQAAHDRTRYVLRRILEEKAESLVAPQAAGESDSAYVKRLQAALAVQEEARKALEKGFTLAFKRGSFRYDSSAVLDDVARRLAEPPFDQVLADAGIADPATAGLMVVTTLDANVQQAATYSLWHHLTEVGTWMEGFGPADFVVADAPPPQFEPDRLPIPQTFRVARLVARPAEQVDHLDADLGGRTCTLDRDALVRVAVASYRSKKKDRYAKAPSAEVDGFVKGLPAEALVRVSVRSVDATGAALCDLEIRPVLQGALAVLEDGQVRAMVGGNDNRNFNRAGALRQMGSTWKPLIYHAALQVGWTPDVVIDNRRAVFPFSTTFYYPRPDHDPAPEVSMSWAGVNSENLASVWLLYHLVDRLDGQAVKAMAGSLGLLRAADESEEAYRTRIQKLGVLPTRGRLVEAEFNQARHEVAASLSAGPHPEDQVGLTSLLYGWGYGAELSRVAKEGSATRAWKERALSHSWTSLETRIGPCEDQASLLRSSLTKRLLPSPASIPDLTVFVDDAGLQVACGAPPMGFAPPEQSLLETLGLVDVAVDEEPEVEVPSDPGRGGRMRGLRGLFQGLPGFALGGVSAAEPSFEVQDVRVDDRLHLSTLKSLEGAVLRRQASRAIEQDVDLYAPEQLVWHQDFRVLLALKYVQSLAQAYGVQTPIQPVLSMPLGASEITLLESASMYEGISSGEAWTFPGVDLEGDVPSPPDATLLIAEIRDVDGRVIYQAKPKSERIASVDSSLMTTDILRNVVRWGTGRAASSAVLAEGKPVPLAGKTGTTNDFKNAAFLGIAPHASPNGYGVDGAFVVAAYVGYDDNREMVNGGIKLAGASGALPAWIGAAAGLQAAGLLGAPRGLDVESGGWPMLQPSTLLRRPVVDHTGLLSEGEYSAGGPSVLVPLPAVEPEPVVRFMRQARPERVAPRTDAPLAVPQSQDVWGRRVRPKRR